MLAVCNRNCFVYFAQVSTETDSTPRDTHAVSADGATTVVDTFTSKLAAKDCTVLVHLLKLAVAKRCGRHGEQALTQVLTALGRAQPEVGAQIESPLWQFFTAW